MTNDKKSEPATAKGPVKTIRSQTQRALAVHVWEREGLEGATYYTYTVSRAYKSKSSGKEGYSREFLPGNAPVVAALCAEAEDFIRALKEPKDQLEAQAA